jgi:hypothetical protein
MASMIIHEHNRVAGFRNYGPIILVYWSGGIVKRRALRIARLLSQRRAEYDPCPDIREILCAPPSNQARGGSNGAQAVLFSLIHPGRLDHGWGTLGRIWLCLLPKKGDADEGSAGLIGLSPLFGGTTRQQRPLNPPLPRLQHR